MVAAAAVPDHFRPTRAMAEMTPTRPGATSLLIPLALGAWPLAWLCLAMKWRLAPVIWPHAWPGPGAGLLAWPSAALLALAAGAAMVLIGVAGARGGLLAALLAWPAFPLVLAWLVIPLHGPTTPLAWGAALAVVAVAAWFARRIRRDSAGRPGPGWWGGRRWRWVHGALLATGVPLGLALGGFDDPAAIAISMLLYPLYAALQLVLMLVLPWPWLLAACRRRSAAAVAAAAILFGLIHWPNPLVMALTAAGMVLWATEHRQGRPLAALAVSMGLLATLAVQGLPAHLTRHMRVGPAAVHAHAVPAVVETTLADLSATSAAGPSPRQVIASLYPPVAGRPASAGELDRWARVVAHERRCFLAWEFLASAEYARRHAGQAPPPMDGTRYWTDLPAPWPARIREQAARAAGDRWQAYVTSCYEELLGRTPSAGEVRGWARPMSAGQYAGLLEAMIARRHRLARAPFDTLASEELRLWR